MSTVASPPDIAAVTLNGRLRARGPGTEACSDHARSYDDLGRCWCWEPQTPHNHMALDVERLTRPLDRGMPQRWAASTPEEFLRRWTMAEVLAKLQMTPVMVWLSNHGLPALPEGEHTTIDTSDGPVALRHFVDRERGLAVSVGHRNGR